VDEKHDRKKQRSLKRAHKSQETHILQSLYGLDLVCKRTDNKSIPKQNKGEKF
jgi:hypothetical protein